MRWSSDSGEATLTEEERERYRRQLMLQGFTLRHQERLKASTALVAGIGGLGGTAAVYLAVAGIGRMVFVHAGTLTLSNMNRQILMRHDWIGKSRVLRARRTIEEVNPDVRVDVFDERISEDNAEPLLEGVQIALSARPNFQERRVLNEACIRRGIPVIEAAVNGTEGYLFNVVPGRTPCLNCLYPEDDPRWEELGFPVLGAVSGLAGSIMGVEAIKLLTGYGRPLLSRMLLFDALDTEFRTVNIRRDENCSVCSGRGPTLSG